jgi:DNA-binding transcriptional LysR family regulator
MLSLRDLPLLATFVQVCRDGSFTAAARSLSISKGLVSARVQTLERALGVRLLERTTRHIALTQTGQDVLSAAERALSAASDVSRIAESKQRSPTGVLRVGAPVDLGALLVAPAVARLCSRYPNLRAELVLSDHKTDAIEHRLDAVLSVNRPNDSAQMSTRLGSDVEIIVASPDLARVWQAVTEPKQLAHACWVAHPSIPISARHSFRNQSGAVQRLAPTEARVLANTGDAIRSLVVGGAGFAVVPMQMVVDDLRSGRMVRVLPKWSGRRVVLHACFPSRAHPPARVKLFLAELRNVFRISGFAAQYADAAPRHPLRVIETPG